MSMSREEIDLREQIAAEIKEAGSTKLNVLKIIRKGIRHNRMCPCSKCKKWVIKTCSVTCDKHRKATPDEIHRFANIQGVKTQDTFDCTWCNKGKNSWAIYELLFDEEEEFLITPCCHTEATEALEIPEDEDGYNQRAEDELSYRYSVTGRF